MLEGVSMVDPANTYIDIDVNLGRESLLLPGTYLQGKTVVGDGCTIGPDVKIVNSTVGAGCQVSFSVIEDSQLPDGTRVGPFTHLRGGEIIPS
jgi:bifunctional UDP-N-acetylglucosamine pyrophosphorylase/glucosamine-1-phosphate N-acetyltransferase